MDPKILIRSNISLYSTPLIIFQSCPSTFFDKRSKLYAKTHVSVLSESGEKCSFWGESLRLNGNLGRFSNVKFNAETRLSCLKRSSDKTSFWSESLRWNEAKGYFLGREEMTVPFRRSENSIERVNSAKVYADTRISCLSENGKKASLWGESLNLTDTKGGLLGRMDGQCRRNVITAVVKRRKELPFDNVIQRDKKLKLVLKIRSILVSQPERIMSLKELGKYRRDLGLTRKRRFIAVLKRFPAIFEIVEQGVFSLKFRLTPEAERVYLDELKVRNEMEGLLVTKLRKLLMMSLDKRILIEKLAHLKADLGLPTEFRDTICQRYPQYFKVVITDRGPALELTHWDPELAISAAEIDEEENEAREIKEKNLIMDRPPKFNRVKLPKGLNLSKGEMRRVMKFKEIPYISPYADFSELKQGTQEKERHACAVVHEILSLTVEKKTLVDHLTHFREEFKFSQQLRGMLIRHPDLFYVSLKGDRDSVFLREAYRDSQLIDKDKLLIIKEKMRAMVTVPRFRGPPRMNPDSSGAIGGSDRLKEGIEDDEGEGEDWSDVDDEDNSDDEEDWSDDDEAPPDFDDANGSVTMKKDKTTSNTEEKLLVSVLPKDDLRERW